MNKIKRQINYYELVKDINIQKEIENRGFEGKISGSNFMTCCPFHEDENPSFGIRITKEKKGLYKCFSCGETGNFFNLISYLDNITFEQTVNKYQKNNIDIKYLLELKTFFENNLKEVKIKKINKIKSYNIKFLNKFQKPNDKFLKYLYSRNIKDGTIKKFNILCCPENKKNTGYAKKWEGRIIIPVDDENGRLVGVTARFAGECNKEFKVRKIKNSDISKVLFGLKYIKDKSILFLMEGEFDVIRSIQEGIPAVQTGKFPSTVQISKLLEYTNNIIYCPDGDMLWKNKNNPKDSVEYQLKRLKKYFNVTYIKLPKDKDPNSLSNKEFKNIFKNYINKDNII